MEGKVDQGDFHFAYDEMIGIVHFPPRMICREERAVNQEGQVRTKSEVLGTGGRGSPVVEVVP